ncbi:MAG: hypothetical protein MMC33_004701 [Icmadophila ericetorum]|nr:hypothetical protein [Icmadophila ericetorum]
MQASPDISTVTVLPPVLARRAACTHTSLKRDYGNYKCSHCNLISKFGWVYRCSQDYETERRLARSIKGEEPIPKEIDENSTDAAKPQLSAWIEKGIKDGHYSPEQIILLRTQRQKVLDCIAVTEAALTKEQDKAAGPFVFSAAKKSYPVSLLFSRRDSAVPEVTSLLEQPVIHPNQQGTSSAASKTLQECTYTCCQFCRPTSRDRAWQSLGDILAMSDADVLAVLEATISERRISDANIVRHIGLRKRRPRLRTFDAEGVPFIDNHGVYHLSRCTSPDYKEEDEGIVSGEPKLTRGRRLQATLRRAFRGLVRTRSNSRASKRTKGSKDSENSEYSKTSSSLTDEVSSENEDESVHISDLPLETREDLMLLQAMRTKLPDDDDEKDDPESLKDAGVPVKTSNGSLKTGVARTKANMESLKNGVVLVEDGIAVTEEAIDMGTADIITHA